MIFQSDIPARYIASVDIDPLCQHVATMMNKIEEQDGKFRAITGDMCTVPVHGDVIINTSCEHITQEQYDIWLGRLPKDSIVVVQSNDYAIAEHIRIAKTLEEFKQQSHLTELWSGSLKTQLYTRWMIIGRTSV
jgi:flavorubredoxin